MTGALDGKRALVTGAARGIGQAIAIALAAGQIGHVHAFRQIFGTVLIERDRPALPLA